MKSWILVLGCYGFVVGPAQAAERWSAESCKHLQEMKADVYASRSPADGTSWMLIPILRFQRDKCGVDTSAEFAAGQVTPKEAAPAPRREPTRRPVLCDTTPKAYGGSTTDCF